MSLNFSADNRSFRSIMGNGVKYAVPRFQRDYAWDVEQWEDLWTDLVLEDQDIEEHYMGYLVLHEVEKRVFHVIDGQQRLTTITILILAVLKILQERVDKGLEPEANKQRIETLRNTYIGFTDPVSLSSLPKLTLNNNNNLYFRNYICGLQKAPVRGTKASEKLLSKALAFFVNKVGSLSLPSGEALAGFVDTIVDRLVFTVIVVSDELNAYKVFETLNARGVKLSTPDLVKNYLFSVIDKEQKMDSQQIRDLDELWEKTTAQLGKHDFSRFIHAEWNSRNPSVHKPALFKKIKQSIASREAAFQYLRNIHEAAEVYAALQDAGDNFWKREEYKAVQSSLRMLDVFNIVQPQGLLMSAYKQFEAEKFVKIARYIEVVSIRYNVICRRLPNIQESVYNQIACGIARGEIKNLELIKKMLREVYPDDADFLAEFSRKHMPTEQSDRKVRYLLARLEERLNGGVPVDDTALTLEHILPSNPSEEWLTSFDSNQMDEYADMLGNMTLLPAAINRRLRNKPYTVKRQAFAESNLSITRKCGNYAQWDREAIEAHQLWLAERAVECWRIEF